MTPMMRRPELMWGEMRKKRKKRMGCGDISGPEG